MKRFFIIITLLITQVIISQESNSEIAKLWTLEDCLQYALENNITIKDAALNYEQAAVDYSKAKSSRLPNLYGTASETFSNGNATNQIYSTNVSLNSSVSLFQGNQINNQIAQNKLLLNQSELLAEEAQSQAATNTLMYYTKKYK